MIKIEIWRIKSGQMNQKNREQATGQYKYTWVKVEIEEELS